MEYFELLNEDGSFSGRRKAREEVHQDGDLHGGSHVWLVRRTEAGRLEVLLQKRCDTKDSFPGCLDVSCAGHLDPGENFIQAAQRELAEELGLLVPEDRILFLFEQRVEGRAEFYGKPFWNREINHVYLLDPTYPVEEIRYQESEISDVVWQDVQVIQRALAQGNPEYCIDPGEFDRTLARCLEIL